MLSTTFYNFYNKQKPQGFLVLGSYIETVTYLYIDPKGTTVLNHIHCQYGLAMSWINLSEL